MKNDLVKTMETYLSKLPETLWGQGWDISDPARRALAALWFAEEFKAIKAVVKEEKVQKDSNTN